MRRRITGMRRPARCLNCGRLFDAADDGCPCHDPENLFDDEGRS